MPDLPLEDGTRKIFLNMTSFNGRPELVSLLQYMKHTTLDNPDILVMDQRIVDLDRIVGEVKQSEEWEVVKMNILEIGLQQGIERGLEQGLQQGLEQGREQGREQGLQQGMEQGIEQGIAALIETCQELGLSSQDTLEKLMDKFSLSESAAGEHMKKYWRTDISDT